MAEHDVRSEMTELRVGLQSLTDTVHALARHMETLTADMKIQSRTPLGPMAAWAGVIITILSTVGISMGAVFSSNLTTRIHAVNEMSQLRHDEGTHVMQAEIEGIKDDINFIQGHMEFLPNGR